MLVEPDVRERTLAHRVRAVVGDEHASEGMVLSDELVSTLRETCCSLDGKRCAVTDVDAAQMSALSITFAEQKAGARVFFLTVEPPLTQMFEGALIVSPPCDVSVEVLADLARALSEERANELARAVFNAVQGAADPMELTDGRVNVIHVNAAFEQFTGYARDQIVGRTLKMLRPQNLDNTSVRFGEAVVERHERWFGVVTSQSRDGGLHPHEVMVTKYDGGRFSGNFCVRRPLKSRTDREAALVHAHREFRVVLSALPEPIAVLVGPLVYFANPALFTLLGRSSEEVVAARFDAFLHPEDAMLFTSRREQEVVTVRLVRPDGSVRSAELGAAGAISFEGLPADIVVVRDTTERRIASERDAHASRLSAIGALAASIAHEINNPLAFVIGNLEAMRGIVDAELDREAVRQPLGDALDGATRIKKIVRELSTFAHFDDDSRKLEAVDVESAVRVALGIVANQIRHTTRVEVIHTPNLFISANEGSIVQVLVNLFVNASQAMSTRRQRDNNLLTVRTSSSSSDTELVEIMVQDTGVGIPPEILRRVFEPFFTTRTASGGSGLGLSVTRDILQRFGGTIEVSSVVGEGSIFTVRLPRALRTMTRTQPPLLEEEAQPKMLSVVVIDDEEGMGRVIRRMLRHEAVETFVDPVKAVARLLEGPPPHVILCDAMMPSLTGPDVFGHVVSKRPELAGCFVFMTGGTFTGRTATFLAERNGRLLPKPFTVRELRTAVLATAEQTPDLDLR